MEARKLNVNFNKSGSGTLTPKLALPITDFRDMGIVPEDREVNYYYSKENKVAFLSKIDLKDYDIIIKKKK